MMTSKLGKPKSHFHKENSWRFLLEFTRNFLLWFSDRTKMITEEYYSMILKEKVNAVICSMLALILQNTTLMRRLLTLYKYVSTCAHKTSTLLRKTSQTLEHVKWEPCRIIVCKSNINCNSKMSLYSIEFSGWINVYIWSTLIFISVRGDKTKTEWQGIMWSLKFRPDNDI